MLSFKPSRIEGTESSERFPIERLQEVRDALKPMFGKGHKYRIIYRGPRSHPTFTHRRHAVGFVVYRREQLDGMTARQLISAYKSELMKRSKEELVQRLTGGLNVHLVQPEVMRRTIREMRAH